MMKMLIMALLPLKKIQTQIKPMTPSIQMVMMLFMTLLHLKKIQTKAKPMTPSIPMVMMLIMVLLPLKKKIMKESVNMKKSDNKTLQTEREN